MVKVFGLSQKLFCFFLALVAGTASIGTSALAASIVVDAATEEVVAADGPNQLWYPASLTKMMTVYVALMDVEAGKLSLDDPIIVSQHAAGQQPVKFGLAPGQTITLRQAIKAAIVPSGNDAAVAIAEKVAGSEVAFAQRMTQTARNLGMTKTVFRNASGLPDNQQVTTARDMAVLAMAIIKNFPQHYHFFNERSVTIGNRTLPTVNSILGSYPGADGLKTGFTCGSGYNLVASAERDGRRLIGVVLGSKNRGERLTRMVQLLDTAFAEPAVRGPALTDVTAFTQASALAGPPTVLHGGDCSREAIASGSTITTVSRISGWGIVFGAFPKKDLANQAITSAKKQLAGTVKGGRPAVIRKDYEGNTRYSALLVGFDQETAGKACKFLWSQNAYCLALSPAVINNPDAVWR